MLKVKTFVFNPFQVNAYALYNETGECILIDPACNSANEWLTLEKFLTENKLKTLAFYNTHGHVDHVAGNSIVHEKLNIPLGIHRDALPFLSEAPRTGALFGFNITNTVEPGIYLADGDIVRVGNYELKILHTPGHAAGSICFYAPEDNFVIVGDVLFKGSIGRTDLPTGDYDTLIASINDKLMTLDDNVRVLCGHGPETTIGKERNSNPFLV
ncbi:MAG: putative metallo-hydrolase [Bacteroidetes bacterium ADurb.Bin408]|nr:MAG: putative metallo-hydrolase [Bacteroidetes bacterium ADurb.Bin408]